MSYGVVNYRALLVVAMTLPFVLVAQAQAVRAQDLTHDATGWTKRALGFAEAIEAGKAREEAFYRLTYQFARQGDFVNALACAENVKSEQKRVYSFAFAARQSAEHNQTVFTQVAITKARETSQGGSNGSARSAVVELLLEFDRIDEAIDFASQLQRGIDRHYAFTSVAAHLAKKGDVDRALSIVKDWCNQKWKDGSYARVSIACAESGAIDRAEQLLTTITDERHRNSVIFAIAKQRIKDGDIEQARALATQIKNTSHKNKLLTEIVDQESNSAGEAQLQERFLAETNRESKITIAKHMTERLVENNELDQAKEWIDKAVQTIEDQPMEPQLSKFGSFGDDLRIAVVKTLNLDIAAALHANDETAKAIDHIKIVRESIESLPEESALGAMFIQQHLLATIMSLKLEDHFPSIHTSTSIGPMKPMGLAEESASLVNAGKIDEAFKIADKIKAAPGGGVLISKLVSVLVKKNEVDGAINLLNRFQTCDDIGYAYESFGQAVGERKNAEEIEASLSKLLTDRGKAHACMGIAQAMSTPAN